MFVGDGDAATVTKTDRGALVRAAPHLMSHCLYAGEPLHRCE
jgi:hypothetical protein